MKLKTFGFIYTPRMKDMLTIEIEPREVVFCRECKYYQDNNEGYPHPECRWGHEETPDPNDYCSFGERNGDV